MIRPTLFWYAGLTLVISTTVGCTGAPHRSTATHGIRVAADPDGFLLEPSGRRFTPWGFNYDHDEDLRLLEDYWNTEWAKVEQDFREMKMLGANVVRVHLQTGRFMEEPDRPSRQALDQLARVLALAEQLDMYLDITGLGCYRKSDVPPWYSALSESERWSVQAGFWEAVAERCAASPAVFCYDLMNEPVVPVGRRTPGEWLGPAFFGTYHYVQFISLDQAGRPREQIAQRWIQRMASAIRRHDQRHLITVGLLDWDNDQPGQLSGFVPRVVVSELDFVSVHLYPESADMQKMVQALSGLSLEKPVLIEETFPLRCSPAEHAQFLDESARFAAGWIGFYWGKPPEELRVSKDLADHLLLAWLERFRQGPPAATP